LPDLFELSDAQPGVIVQDSEFCRLLGYPAGYALEGRSKELADWVRQWYDVHGRPWIYARQVNALEIRREEIVLERVTFSAPRLGYFLNGAQAHSAALVAVSAGRECEEKARELWGEEKPDEYFFLEVYGSAVVESLVAAAAFRLCAWADLHGLTVLPHYSPGYPGWDISQQTSLFDILRSNAGGVSLPLRVLTSGMLQPKKSLLAVFGITSRDNIHANLSDFIPCENCSLPACQYRRAPYRRFLPRLERTSRTAAPNNQTKEER